MVGDVTVTGVSIEASRAVKSSDMDDHIEFWCAVPEHHLTMVAGSRLQSHDGSWAYCPIGAPVGHRWLPTGGMQMAEVEAALRPSRLTRHPGRALRLN